MKKSLILFIHGIGGSSAGTWGKFPELIRADNELAARFDVALDDYPSLPKVSPLKRSGGLEMAADGLRSRITNVHDAYSDIVIVAHSQGGVIALRYILNCIRDERSLPVSHLIAFASPFNGAANAAALKHFGEQVEDLAPASKFMFTLQKDWQRLRDRLPVKIRAVVGGNDAIVSPASVVAVDKDHEVIHACDHLSIVKPSSSKDESFAITKRFLLGSTQPTPPRPPVCRPMVLREENRQRLAEHLQGLLSLPVTNAWQSEWNTARAEFEEQLENALVTATPDAWRCVSVRGRELRKQIRDTAQDPVFLPPYIDKLSACTDAIEEAFEAASGNAANFVPYEQDELIGRIENLVERTGNERVVLEAGIQSPDLSSAKQWQIDELLTRLDSVVKELTESKRHAIQVEQINLFKFDPALIIALMRDALEALKQGVDLLDDQRFSEGIRRGAKATWLAGRRYVHSARRQFATFKVPWSQEKVFEDFERREPHFGLPPENRTGVLLPASPNSISFLVRYGAGMRKETRTPGDGVPFVDCWEQDSKPMRGPEMVAIPRGEFVMGSPLSESERFSNEGPQRLVSITEPLAVGRNAVTVGEFANFIAATGREMAGGAYVRDGTNWAHDPSKSWRDPGFRQDDSHPAVCVNWHDATAYAAWLNEKSEQNYRLLSEAEWEYVARAGRETPFWWGTSITSDQANYGGTADISKDTGEKGERQKMTVPVERFEPNPFGLFQVHGNTWEWVDDRWNENYEGAPIDGSAWTAGERDRRVVRGGSWYLNSRYLRAGCRGRCNPNFRDNNIGFRLARTLSF